MFFEISTYCRDQTTAFSSFVKGVRLVFNWSFSQEPSRSLPLFIDINFGGRGPLVASSSSLYMYEYARTVRCTASRLRAARDLTPAPCSTITKLANVVHRFCRENRLDDVLEEPLQSLFMFEIRTTTELGMRESSHRVNLSGR